MLQYRLSYDEDRAMMDFSESKDGLDVPKMERTIKRSNCYV